MAQIVVRAAARPVHQLPIIAAAVGHSSSNNLTAISRPCDPVPTLPYGKARRKFRARQVVAAGAGQMRSQVATSKLDFDVTTIAAPASTMHALIGAKT